MKEKFSVKVGEQGVIISSVTDGVEKHLSFTPSEALMLLDILNNEAQNLEEMAIEASPIPIKLGIASGTN